MDGARLLHQAVYQLHSRPHSRSKSPRQHTNKYVSRRRSIESTRAPFALVKPPRVAQNALSTKCSAQRPLTLGSSAARSKSLYPNISRASSRGLSPRQRSPTQSTLVGGSKSPRSNISRTSTSRLSSSSRTQPPSRGRTQPPSRGHTQPPSRGRTQPPSHGHTQPPSRGRTQPPSRGSDRSPSSPTSGCSRSRSLTPDEGDQPKRQ
ncbi:hypothetical protein P692DRAFT_20880322, partial [Suillus brevipes Sb2]